jgi:pimeloyl-ACP methyl ester carboxylesterase
LPSRPKSNMAYRNIAVIATLVAFCAVGHAQAASTVGDCRIGAYRLQDGDVVEVGPSNDNALRWRKWDGETGALKRAHDDIWTSTRGWTEQPDGHEVSFAPCSTGDLTFDKTPGRRIDFDVTYASFVSHGATLAGRLVLPKGDAAVPLVVLVHGSESYSALDLYALQWLLPAEGVGVFVYDKRGTGHSSGAYTQNFDVLADDAVAAMAEGRRLAGPRAGRTGFEGGSQGGWIAPLAASRTRADFSISSFGLLVTPLEEDREEIVLQMKLKRHSLEEIAKALEIADAAGRLMSSNFTEGFARFDALRAKYKDAPWYKDLEGNFTGTLLPLSEAEMQAKAKVLNPDVPWHHDGMAVQRKLRTPQLWIQASDDLDAPSAETNRRLKTLQSRGKPITIVMFPHTQHGIYEYETKSDGERANTRNPDGYFALLRDFALGALNTAYGDSAISPAKNAS